MRVSVESGRQRRWLAISVSLSVIASSLCFAADNEASKPMTRSGNPIDRQALVKRYNPVNLKADPFSPLSVGNGEFAFTADITGLQTFEEFYRKGIPLGTLSQWGWHTFPNPRNHRLEDTFRYYDTQGRNVGYPYSTDSDAVRWLRANPHRLGLGRIGLEIKKSDGSPVELRDLERTTQKLDLWAAMLISSFAVEGEPVQVETCCHPGLDMIAVRIDSPLAAAGRLGVVFCFPYASGSFAKLPEDWGKPECHGTTVIKKGADRIDFGRKLDADEYHASVVWSPGGTLKETAKHRYLLAPGGEGGRFEFVCAFSPERIAGTLPDVAQTRSACRAHWERFWTEGGVIDLSESKDPRAHELQRRIVLSQYLTAIQCAGSTPPQETGLTHNSWHGKFHLEMHWWHAAHFPLWGRVHLLERSLSWYPSILAVARETANRQGFAGVRWPKMVGPEGRESPSTINPFILWQQPHLIQFAELCYRVHGDRATLEKYKDLVFESAEFMASYPTWEEAKKRYVLGPPVIPYQETYRPEQTTNPAFEVAYWDFGLKLAQEWRERLGLPRNLQWDHVLEHLSPLPVKDGLYVATESVPNTFGDPGCRWDHPSFLGAFGLLPGPMVDRETMRRTLHKVVETWQWERAWSTDFPLTAMTAARLGEAELAVDVLLMDSPKNTYLANGHCCQGRDILPVYLPANGGLLTATAMMAAGWDGGPDRHAPGFPADGNWTVRWEGLKPKP